MQTHSIRFRLTLWYAVVLTAGLALFSSLLWIALRHQLLADLDEDLQGRASRLESFFRSETAKDLAVPDELEEFCQALPPTSYVTLRGNRGFDFQYPKVVPVEAASLRMFRREFSLNDQGYYLEVGASTAEIQHVLQVLAFLLLTLIPVVIAIAAFGGAWLSGRALKPVQDVTAAALMISIENLSGRLPVPETRDELARLTEVLNSMLSRLEAAVKTLSQFAADASHELRTPLAVIRTTAELALRRGRSADSYRDSLQDVLSETERMTHLVEDLLALARTDAAITQMPRSPIDVRDILGDVFAEMSSLAEARRVDIELALGNEPAIISANRPALHRLFVVLLDNALKYSPAGGSVAVKLDRDDSTIAVTVQDSGAGISETDLPHIFERFYRADKARSGPGHGLGLALADNIARAHAAHIEVRSIEGSGSAFRVSFARREAPSERSVAATTSAALVR